MTLFFQVASRFYDGWDVVVAVVVGGGDGGPEGGEGRWDHLKMDFNLEDPIPIGR